MSKSRTERERPRRWLRAARTLHRTLSLTLAIAAAGCASSSEPGVELRFVSEPVALSPASELPSVPGQSLLLDELEWTVAELELVPCRSVLRRAADWVVPAAHAHGLSNPTRLASPTVLRATAGDEAWLGALHPPAGRYCGIRYTLGQADPDAAGLAASPAMRGRSIFAHAHVGAEPAAESELAIESTRQKTAEYPLELELTAAGQVTVLRFSHGSAGWLEGVDVRSSAVQRETRLFENFLGSIEVRAE